MKSKLVAALAFLLAAPFIGRAQQAFENLSLGIELGTVGVGVELAVPVVTGHVVVKAGFNAPSLSYPFSATLSSDGANAMIDGMNARLESLVCTAGVWTAYSRANTETVTSPAILATMYEALRCMSGPAPEYL